MTFVRFLKSVKLTIAPDAISRAAPVMKPVGKPTVPVCTMTVVMLDARVLSAVSTTRSLASVPLPAVGSKTKASVSALDTPFVLSVRVLDSETPAALSLTLICNLSVPAPRSPVKVKPAAFGASRVKTSELPLPETATRSSVPLETSRVLVNRLLTLPAAAPPWRLKLAVPRLSSVIVIGPVAGPEKLMLLFASLKLKLGMVTVSIAVSRAVCSCVVGV